MSSLRPSSAVSQITGASAALTTATSRSGSIWPVPKLACRSAPEPAASLRVVAVHQVDAAGDGLDAVDRVDQRLTRGPRVAGVQAEANPLVADVIPQPADGVEVAGHRVVAAGGVLQIHLHVGFEIVQRLDPPLEAGLHVVVVGVTAVHDHRRRVDLRGRVAGLLQDLARRDADAIVGRRHVDQVRRVDVQRACSTLSASRRPRAASASSSSAGCRGRTAPRRRRPPARRPADRRGGRANR